VIGSLDYIQVGKMVEVFYCSKELLYPKYGCAVPSKQVVYVRDDLPGFVKEFVTAHELYHLRDKAKCWVWREIKANTAGALRHPMGFVICALMSLAPYRLWYYWKRIIGMAE
jgi:hypothetical protein